MSDPRFYVVTEENVPARLIAEADIDEVTRDYQSQRYSIVNWPQQRIFRAPVNAWSDYYTYVTRLCGMDGTHLPTPAELNRTYPFLRSTPDTGKHIVIAAFDAQDLAHVLLRENTMGVPS